jgi:hypothetical protein
VVDRISDWFEVLRPIVVFVLGVFMIIFAAITKGHDVPFIVAGLILLGIVPVEQWMTRRERRERSTSS